MVNKAVSETAASLEALRRYIADAPPERRDALLEALRALEAACGGKRAGLCFESRTEPVERLMKTRAPMLREDEALYIDRGGPMNYLIEGDNLAALRLLRETHAGRIDVIYIDPPYNTGKKSEDAASGFLYDDGFAAEDGRDPDGPWLSFLEKRLRPARELLSEGGVIFISIDDNELAQLKLLCDDVFGRSNFIAVLPRVTKRSGKDHGDAVARNHDYVVVYAKNRPQALFNGLPTRETGYPLTDEYSDTRGGYKLNQTLDYDSLWYNPKMDFPLTVDGEIYYPGGDERKHLARHAGEHKPKDWVWRWSREKFEFGLANGFVVIRQGRGRPRIYTKTYANASISTAKPYRVVYRKRETRMSSLALTDNRFSNDNAKKEITALGLENFGFPKPTALIEALLRITERAETVLDFFAGSGTTGHAVMRMNRDTGARRSFILCNNNQNDICRSVTYERLKRVIERDGYEARLKYYRVEYPESPDEETLRAHRRAVSELKGGEPAEEETE